MTETEGVEEQIETIVMGLAHVSATPVTFWLDQSLGDLGRWIAAGNKLGKPDASN